MIVCFIGPEKPQRGVVNYVCRKYHVWCILEQNRVHVLYSFGKGQTRFFLREGVGQFQKRNPCTAKTVEKSAMCNVLSTIQVHAPENCPSPPHPLKNNGPNLSCFDCNCVFATISMYVFIH